MRNRDETILQEHFCHYLDAKGILYTASMMGVFLPVKYAVMRKRCGVKAGHPDLAIYEPRDKWHGLFIELKISGYPTPEQKIWQEELNKRGYKAVIMPTGMDFSTAFNWLRNLVEDYLIKDVDKTRR
jgi:hypothetical protein